MTATSNPRTATTFAGLVPARVTLPMAADELILKGTIVCINGDARAVAGVDGEGFAAVGKASANFDNRTGSEAGGGAGDISCEAECGVFSFAYTGTVPEPGQVVYVVDNQTVSLDSDSGQRGIAGYVSEVRDSQAYILMGPTVAGQIVIAAAEASDLDQAQVDIDALEAAVADLEADVEFGEVTIPMTAFRLVASAAVPAEYVDGTDGFEVADSESLCYRFNDDSTAAIVASVPLPSDLDGAGAVTVHVMGARVGSADATAAITVGAFFQVTGAAHNADANCGGATTAFDGATTVITEETLAIAHADVPDGPAVLTLTLVPTAALAADDLRVFGVRLTYTRSIASA